MSIAESPINATPVGHQGARVDITERPAVAVNGWFGVLVLAACVAGTILARHARQGMDLAADPRLRPGRDLAGDRPAGADLGGPVLRPLHRHGPPLRLLVGGAADGAPPGQHPGAQLRDRPPEGQRRRRQPGRDRRHRGLAGGRHGQVDLRRGQLRRLRLGAGRVRPAPRRREPSLRRHHRRRARRCAARPTSSPASWRSRWPSGSPSPGSRSSRSGSRHLAYAQEIAQAMLRRQQANAVVAARSRIVEGAVGMVEMALSRLNEGGVV